MIDLISNCNVIKQVKVSDLLDDRYFFIPSYQRGYRWTKQQIYDLCNDLLEYTLKSDKSPESFYSLQPLIVRKGQFEINGKLREAYEVIDGQQRLTTIFLLYRFLAKSQRYQDLSDVSKDLNGKMLYHVYYETRPEDYSLLEKTGFEVFSQQDIRDIDIAHVSNALHYMKCWLENSKEIDPDCAESLCRLYNEEYTRKTVVERLFDLLNDRNKKLGSVQFIWYEIDATKDAIKEFLTENKGKIGLTDTEKIRALFMQRSNFDPAIRNLKQLSIAKDWELVENTLHRNDFWSFVSNDISLEDGRIDIIFKYIFDNDPEASDISQEGDYLFRYYYRHLTKKDKTAEGSVVVGSVEILWKQVMDCFRMLQNWYYNPKIYNLVGLLVKHGYSIKKISDIYNRDSVNTHNNFIYELNREIRTEIIDPIPIYKGDAELDIQEGEEYIHLFFDNYIEKAMIPDLLRFINIREMNKTIDQALSEIDKEDDEKKRSDLMRGARDVISHIYRFPFEALDVFGWDIEHIDSATTNSLTKPKEQEAWLIGAEKTLGEKLLKDDFYSKQRINKENADEEKEKEILNAMVNRVYDIVEEDNSKKRKNWIGNLTLLDSGTNRSYKNKIFAWKKDILQERIRSGVFVPVCTQNVFNKVIPGATHVDWKWSHEDKKAYHAYILNEINEFKKDFDDEDTTAEIITD
jgi:uncharacterized protein with ParB-like and HNH nuclease domain